MTEIALSIDPGAIVKDLEQVRDQVQPEGSLVLDFSSVRRLDAGALHALESLAEVADQKSATIKLHGLNVAAYKVLKVADVAARFSFTGEAQSGEAARAGKSTQ